MSDSGRMDPPVPGSPPDDDDENETPEEPSLQRHHDPGTEEGTASGGAPEK